MLNIYFIKKMFLVSLKIYINIFIEEFVNIIIDILYLKKLFIQNIDLIKY